MHYARSIMRQRVGAAFMACVILAWSGVGWSATAEHLINVNTASAVELQALPGIGPKKAEAIISFRVQHGAFSQVDDLVRVKGIGPKTLAKIRPLVTCGKRQRAERGR